MNKFFTNTIKLIKTNKRSRDKFSVDIIPYLLKSVENADRNSRNEIENYLVNMGTSIIPDLIKLLKNSSFATKGLISSVLIRLGEESVPYLASSFKDTEYQWIADYLISEIQCSEEILALETKSAQLQKTFAG